MDKNNNNIEFDYFSDQFFNPNNTCEKITRFWLAESSAVQVQHQCEKCNTGAKSVTPVQITHLNSGLWFAERHWESCRPMISCKRQWPKFCTETLKKFFSNVKKRASRNTFWHFFHANFFMFVLLISNHTVFLVQFGINLHLWVFQKDEIALAEAAGAISA